MNILLWLNEPHLREVVILNPIDFFVNPAATIVCKLVPTEGDPTRHITAIHRDCQRTNPNEFEALVESGRLNDCLLLPLLLEKCNNSPIAVSTVVRMMVKYGLLVPLMSSDISGSEVIPGVKQYIVPMLLPDVGLDSRLLGKKCEY
jgi:hypothetical protein